MALIFTQTDTAADNGASAGCSAATLAATPQAQEMTEGGTPGVTELTVSFPAGSTAAPVMFQTNTGEPGLDTWDAGDHVVRLNVTTANSELVWTETHVCIVNGVGDFFGHASLTGQTVLLGTTGVKSMTVNRGVTRTVPTASMMYIVLVIQSNGLHGNSQFGFTPNQNIDTPLVAGATVAESDLASAGASAASLDGLSIAQSGAAASGVAAAALTGSSLLESIVSSAGSSASSLESVSVIPSDLLADSAAVTAWAGEDAGGAGSALSVLGASATAFGAQSVASGGLGAPGASLLSLIASSVAGSDTAVLGAGSVIWASSADALAALGSFGASAIDWHGERFVPGEVFPRVLPVVAASRSETTSEASRSQRSADASRGGISAEATAAGRTYTARRN